MNISALKISEDVEALCHLAPKRDLDDFFQSMIDQDTSTIGDLSPEDLTALQTRVRLFKEIRFTFTQISDRVRQKEKQ